VLLEAAAMGYPPCVNPSRSSGATIEATACTAGLRPPLCTCSSSSLHLSYGMLKLEALLYAFEKSGGCSSRGKPTRRRGLSQGRKVGKCWRCAGSGVKHAVCASSAPLQGMATAVDGTEARSHRGNPACPPPLCCPP